MNSRALLFARLWIAANSMIGTDHFASLPRLPLEASSESVFSHERLFEDYGVLADKFRVGPNWHPDAPTHYAARYSDIAPSITSAWGMWYAGTAFHSYAIRIGTFSGVSHAGMLQRRRSGEIRLLDVVEFHGGRNKNFEDEVGDNPGKYYVAPINHAKFPEFDTRKAVDAALALVGTPYGRLAVGFEALTHIVGFRELAYFIWLRKRKDVDAYFAKYPPYCSDAQKQWDVAGGCDPVPSRSPYLTTPADMFESLLYSPIKVAIYPG
jgi:hypothetical protein